MDEQWQTAGVPHRSSPAGAFSGVASLQRACSTVTRGCRLWHTLPLLPCCRCRRQRWRLVCLLLFLFVRGAALVHAGVGICQCRLVTYCGAGGGCCIRCRLCTDGCRGGSNHYNGSNFRKMCQSLGSTSTGPAAVAAESTAGSVQVEKNRNRKESRSDWLVLLVVAFLGFC